jgi:ABC-type transport system substrate-binding protein/DNA-binding SARP family transcriptional activator
VGIRVEFAVLGPLEVRLDGAPAPIGGPKQRALLAMLLCNANRVVPRDRLIAELNPDRCPEPPSADRLLRVQISRLRKALAVNGDEPRLVARPGGYLLRVEAGELDLDEFQTLVRTGRHAVAKGEPEQAAATLREAESLWRGRPLADLDGEPFTRIEIPRLEELYAAAVEDRIEAELALGRHAALCGELEALVAEHPLRERLRGQLMVALYRSGRQAEALANYRAARAQLAGELGLEPGPQLRQLQRAILRQDPSLDLDETRQPSSSITVAENAPRTPPRQPVARTGLSGHRPRLRLAAVVAVIAAAVTALAFVVGLGTTHRPPLVLAGNSLALLGPDDGDLRAVVGLAASPGDTAAAFGSVWVAEPGAGVTVRVDQRSRTVVATIPVGRRPGRIIASAGSLWVADALDGTLSRIDPGTDTVVQTVTVGGGATGIAVSAGGVWITSHDTGMLLRIEARTGRLERRIDVGVRASGVAAEGNSLWVANDQTGLVVRVDARSGTVEQSLRVGDAPAVLAASPDAVWVLNPLDATLSRIDPRRGQVDATVALGGEPTSLALVNGSLWAVDEQQGTLFKVDTARAVSTMTIGLGVRVRALTIGDGLWVAGAASLAVHRGGTLTSALFSGGPTTIDPAASTSTNLFPPLLFGLTNDGLVTLNHASGRDGARLVPDLALAMPAPADGGRTYTFHLRPGLRYSTGAVVKPTDVTHSFERLFRIGSSGADFYTVIAGTSQCARAPAACELSHGVVADDHANTVTFHLARPDPDFLYKLTLTYADVLPASTADRQARVPLPATGPYMLSSYVPGRTLHMVRNPHFHEWSAAAQPDGYPDEIVFTMGRSDAQATAAVAAGKLDFLGGLGFPNAAASFRSHYPTQVHIRPQAGTSALALNVTAPPFDDVRVRQALNLALDRNRIVQAVARPVAATPTCQILPPGLPGYRRYCPYTKDPRADGRYQGPDLAKARRLVAASGTKGMTVHVWDDFSVGLEEARLTVTALRQLGYRASLRQLPDSTYFTYTNDSRNHAQVIDGGWGADYPSANNFLGRLTCRCYVPADGVANTDASDFCDPAYDIQVARAAALQETDLLAADALWARLDHRLTDLAIWLPTVTPNETDLLSSRVRNYQYHPIWGALIDQLWLH